MDYIKNAEAGDSRTWLGSLPNTDLFSCHWIACDKNGSWYVHKDEPSIEGGEWGSRSTCWEMVTEIMPDLADGQWRESKVSIEDLKAWQRTNK